MRETEPIIITGSDPSHQLLFNSLLFNDDKKGFPTP